MLVPGAVKVKVAEVPASPVCGLDAESTPTIVMSDEQVALEPL
jgi:hypothetical protein